MTTSSETTLFLNRSLAELIPEEGERRSVIRALMEDAPATVSHTESTMIHAWYIQAVARLMSGEPVQYITGRAPFYGHFFRVTQDVLIPRPETEELVDQAIRYLKSLPEKAIILDLGTGSGCIAISIKAALPISNVIAWDISESALQIARGNALDFGLDIAWQRVDALDESAWTILPPLDLLISNPPYIAVEEAKNMEPQVLNHEPHLALFPSGPDPLIFYRAMAKEASRYLKPGGKVLCECSSYRAGEVERLFQSEGWKDVRLDRDMSGHDRILSATAAY